MIGKFGFYGVLLAFALESQASPLDSVQFWKGTEPYDYDHNYVWEPPVYDNLKKDHPSFDIISAVSANYKFVVGGMDFLPDGRMVLADWGKFGETYGSIYLLSNLEGGPSGVTVEKIAQDIWEPLGVVVADGEIYYLAQDGIWRLEKNTGAGYTKKPFQSFPVPLKVGGYWPVAMCLYYFQGAFWFTTGGYGNASADKGEGYVFRMPKADPKAYEIISRGLRHPAGLGFTPDGAVFSTDNQGEWRRSSAIYHVKRGKHMLFFQYFKTNPVFPAADSQQTPAIWVPHGEAGCSPTEMFYLDSGPYAKQFLVGDNRYGSVSRASIEIVKGVYQGAYFPFSGIDSTSGGIHRFVRGPDGMIYWGALGHTGANPNWSWNGKTFGLWKMNPNGKPTFDLQDVRSIKSGFGISFTDPASVNAGKTTTYKVSSWRYGAPAVSYGGIKEDFKTNSVTAAALSNDGKRVNLTIQGMVAGRVYRIEVDSTLASATGLPIWTKRAWYTLNAISDDEAVAIQDPGAPLYGHFVWARARSGQRLEIRIPDAGAFQLEVRDTRGRIIGQDNGIGPITRTLALPQAGLWWVKVSSKGGEDVKKVYGF